MKKALHKGEPSGIDTLPDLRAALDAVEPWEAPAIESAVSAFCESRGLGMGKAAQPLRVAITGAGVSPGLGDTLELVGKQSALQRIDRCLAECSQPA